MEVLNWNYNDIDGLIIETENGDVYIEFSVIRQWAKQSRVLEQSYDWLDAYGEHRQSRLFDFKSDEFDNYLEAYLDTHMNQQECEDLLNWAIINDKL